MVSSRGVAMFVILAAVGMGACATYRGQLARSQRAFDQNDHERTLASLRDLEPDMKRLTLPEQAQYAYLRGMSDYRIGYRSDARYWLSLARAYEENSPGVMPTAWKARTNEALDELNAVVFAQGTGALSSSRRTEPDDAKNYRHSNAKEESPGAKEAPANSPSAPPN